MSDTILTLKQLGDLFYDLTVSLIGGTTAADVRRTWPTYGAPAFEVTDDVSFYKIYDVESSMSKLREEIYSQAGSPEAGLMETVYTRTLRVDWSFYGPSSWDNAILVRNGLFHQENRDVLAVQNIYMVPDFAPPKRVPELFQGLWYERMDLSVMFNEKVVVGREVPFIETVPIGIIDHSGVVVDEVVTEDTIVRE